MSRETRLPLFAVVRVDWFQFQAHQDALTPDDVSQFITIKEVLESHDEAQAEVARLNQLQAERGVKSFYYGHPTRDVTLESEDAAG